MEASAKKPILIGVIVVCLVSAGLITYLTNRPTGGLDALAGTTLWVKCANEKCGASYEMDRKDYFLELQEEARTNVDAPRPLPLTCKECGQKSLFQAVKCEKCGEVFFEGAAGDDAPIDECPKCGYSELAERKKSRGRR